MRPVLISSFVVVIPIFIFTTTAPATDWLWQVTTDPESDYYPSWSPDGTMIAFYSYRTGDYTDIWTIPAGGGTPTQVTTDPANDRRPAWSPGGTTIAFSSDRNGNWDIWTIPVGGGTATQVTTDPAFDYDPSWSPDGFEISFDSDRNGNGDIWVVPAAGGTATQLTADLAHDLGPAWSPDGTTIAFFSERSGNLDIWTDANNYGPGHRLRPLLVAGRLDYCLYFRPNRQLRYLDYTGSRWDGDLHNHGHGG
jgi:Tol biopolymer transport system component